MTTDFLQQRTQVGFNFPGSSYIPSGFVPTVSVPQRSMGVGQTRAAHQMNQLQFNLAVPSSPEKLVTKFRRPQPIFIEKIKEESPRLQESGLTGMQNFYPVTQSVSSSMSSDRLALAVHLAKRDLRKVKEQGLGNVLAVQEEQVENKHVSFTPKDRGGTGKKGRGKNHRVITHSEAEEAKTLRERVHTAVKKQDVALKRKHELVFYPAQPGQDDDFESDREKQQAREIRKLRKELHEYMKKMEELKQERPEVLRNKDKRLKRRREDEVRLSDEDVDQRQVARAEEQASRSARMLYVLQRQVREIEDELNKRGRGIRHTKKSQTLSRLAAAHRGAVRALQTFVSHAPLQPKLSHGLPPMYQELSGLVRQLTLLAAQLHVGGDEISGERKRIEQEEKVEQEEPKVNAANLMEKTSAFIQEVAGTPSQQAERLKPTLTKQVMTSSPDPTPERDAVLQAGLSAILRARDTPISTPMVKPKVQEQKAAVQPSKPVKQSVLLPSKLKQKRQKAQQAVKRVKLPQAVEQARFTKDTVASILKKAPSGEGVEKPSAESKTPPRTPTKEVPRSPGRISEQDRFYTSREHARRHDHTSPRDPRQAQRMLERDIIEREIARQRWLDEESERRLQELEDLRRAENRRRSRMSTDAMLSRRVLSEAEEVIRSRLQPLLDRAETIAELNTRRELEHKRSLQHQLGKLASQTTMNQGDILAEKVLDDILEETVLEMQRLEADDEDSQQAEQLQSSSTLENLLDRLQAFEKEEEEIRRHWVQVKYADVQEPATRAETENKTTSTAKDPTPIIFTRSKANADGRLTSEHGRSPREKVRRHNEILSGVLNEVSEKSSLSSIGGSLSSRSSEADLAKVCGDVKPSYTRPLTTAARSGVPFSIPSEMRASIASYRNRYNRYLRDTATHEQGTFDPWGLVNRISEDLLEDVLHDVGNELDHVCGDYAEALYSEEFVAEKSEN